MAKVTRFIENYKFHKIDYATFCCTRVGSILKCDFAAISEAYRL